MFQSLFVLLLITLVSSAFASSLLSIKVADSVAKFQIFMNGVMWFESAPLQVFVDGDWRKLSQTTTTHSNGTDRLGKFKCVNISWNIGSSTNQAVGPLHTSLKTYAESDIAVFVQQLPQGATNTNASNPVLPGHVRQMDPGNYPPIINFPSFTGGEMDSLRYVTWQSRMSNVEWGVNVAKGPTGTEEPLLNGTGLQGLSTGPVVMFDHEFNSLVVAPMDHFKNAVNYIRRPSLPGLNKSTTMPIWELGVSSEITTLPLGFEHRTMLVADKGITQTLDTWGKAFRKVYRTNRTASFQQDVNIEYLSYWTDNGAYYSGGNWGEPQGGRNVNEAAFKAVAAGLEKQELLDAVKIWQLDDWWYAGKGGPYSACVEDWALSKTNFPSGLKNLSQALKTPWLLYVPYWCPNNTYSKEFRFVQSFNPQFPELIFAEPHPDDALAFYRKLFDYGISNGMIGFENDYLDYNFLSIPFFRREYGAATKWLTAMNTAAVERNIPVQMCMALPSDLMASVALNAMTNYRASTDYGINDSYMRLQPTDDNINIGGSSLLGFALDLRPSKDIFWTHRPENCRGDPKQDPEACGLGHGAHTNVGSNCELNTIVATLSTGPVGLADKAGDTNLTLVRRCIRKDGRILQPSKPATSVDSMFALPGPGSDDAAIINNSAGVNIPKPKPQRRPPASKGAMVTAASTTLATAEQHQKDQPVWHYVVSIDVTTPFKLHGDDFYPKMPSATNSQATSSPSFNASCGVVENRTCEADCTGTPGCTILRSFTCAGLPACCAACIAEPACKVYTMNSFTTLCHLRTAVSPVTEGTMCTTGTLAPPPPPPPPPPMGEVQWVAHEWFTGHTSTPCANGSKALASRCISAAVRTADDIPMLHNTRPIMVENDTKVYDLLELAPVVHGWVLLGEVDRYVRVSHDRFDRVDFTPDGIRAVLSGMEGETITVTALEPMDVGDHESRNTAIGDSDVDWVVRVQTITFGESGKANLKF